jgi:hypothetical protein
VSEYVYTWNEITDPETHAVLGIWAKIERYRYGRWVRVDKVVYGFGNTYKEATAEAVRKLAKEGKL